MKIPKPIVLAGATLLVAAGTSMADVAAPKLDVTTLAGDSGVLFDGGVLRIDATAFSLIPISGPGIDIPDVEFSLAATPGVGGFFSGTLSVGTLLQATFDDLVIVPVGTGGILFAGLDYTGGSLMTVAGTGRIEGGFGNASSNDFTQAFSADTLSATVGSVVPIPAAVWSFASALAALFALRRRPATVRA